MIKDITIQLNDSFVITGVDRGGKRFKQETHSPIHALGINMWKGSVWLLREGKRTLLKRVDNG